MEAVAGNLGGARKVLLILGGAILILIGFSWPQTAQGIEVVGANDSWAKWSGPVASIRIGEQSTNAGDINGDGLDDFAITARAPLTGVMVLFGPLTSGPAPNLTELAPGNGYRISTASTPTRVSNVGDQNGDGLDDLSINVSSTSTVVYSVADPATDLAVCPSATSMRCVDLADPVESGGDRLGYAITSSGNSFANPWTAGDFNGDGDDEILAPDDLNKRVVVMDNGLGNDCSPTPGLCSIDIDTLTAPDVVVIKTPGVDVPFGDQVSSPGDVNDDGKDDILAASGSDGSRQPGLWVIYGQDWQSSPIETSSLTDAQGFEVSLPFSTVGITPFAPGDVNGDGLQDVGLQSLSIVPALSTFYTVLYGRPGTPGEDLSADPPASGTGIQYEWDGATLGVSGNSILTTLGDLNGDGGSEFAIGNPATAVNGFNTAGVVNVIQSQGASAPNLIPVNDTSPNSLLLRLGGFAASQNFGNTVVSAGDANGDGINDVAVGAPRVTNPNPAGGTFTNSGTYSLVASSSYYSTANTGLVTVNGDTSANVGGVADANRRETTAYFQYGTSSAYSDSTDPEAIGKMSAGKFVEAELTGLTPETEYHYRLVTENDLGIKSYGIDRVFTTDETPMTPCEIDESAPGCPKYNYCEAHPTDVGCRLPVASLGSLIANPSAGKAKRRGKVTVRTWITSTGTKAAEGVKVCASGPKKLVQIVGPKCRKIGSLSPGATGKAQFRIKVKPKARKGAKPTIKLVASATGLTNKTAKARFSVR